MKRVNIRITDEMHEYYKEESKRMGIPMSILMLMSLQTFIEERQAIKMMEKVPGMVEMMEGIKSKLGGEGEGPFPR